MHCFLLRDVDFGEPVFQVLSWWCLCYWCKDWNTVARLFFFSFFFFWQCASVLLLGYCVVEEDGYSWYLRDINIFPLSKKGI
jgi:hypothetical protein